MSFLYWNFLRSGNGDDNKVAWFLFSSFDMRPGSVSQTCGKRQVYEAAYLHLRRSHGQGCRILHIYKLGVSVAELMEMDRRAIR